MKNNEEKWMPVKGYDLYEVSNTGKIKNRKTGRILKQSHSNTGYSFVSLRGHGMTKTHSVHRLVMQAFNPIEEAFRYDVNHKDWNKLNNNLDNLEWMTRSENLLHGSGPTELKVLESMLHNAMKAALHGWYNKLLSVKCTKEAFTEKVIAEAIKDATDYFSQYNK